MNTEAELLYEVDDQDQVIGPCRRGEAHRQQLRHRAVHLLVFKPSGEIFLQQRALGKDIHPGLWDTSAAGHVDYGESYDECALRELREELDLTPGGLPEPLFKLNASEHTGWEFVQVYRVVHSGEIRPNATEIMDGRWFDADELDAWVAGANRQQLTAAFRLIWQTFRMNSRN